MTAHESSGRRCGWCHKPIPAFVRRMAATLRLPPGLQVDDLVIDRHPVTATVPRPESFYARQGDAVIILCGDGCREALERAVDNDTRARLAAPEPAQSLGQRIRERTVPCSWCGGQLPRDRMPYVAPVSLPWEPELTRRKGTTVSFRLAGAMRQGHVPDFDPGNTDKKDGAGSPSCSAAPPVARRCAPRSSSTSPRPAGTEATDARRSGVSSSPEMSFIRCGAV
jgi:hypothetical protein